MAEVVQQDTRRLSSVLMVWPITLAVSFSSYLQQVWSSILLAALAPGFQMGRSFRRADQTIRSVGAAVASTLNGRRSTTPACLACLYHPKKSINSVGISPASPSPFAGGHALNSHTGHLF